MPPKTERFTSWRPWLRRSLPWAAVLGNHDEQSNMQRDELIPFIQSLPGALTVPGPDTIHGYGNYVLEVSRNRVTREGFPLVSPRSVSEEWVLPTSSQGRSGRVRCLRPTH
jgi:hypothetical protein